MADRKRQDPDLIFALDIGTRSIIGIVGRVEDERLKVLAIEKEEHGKRSVRQSTFDGKALANSML